MTEDEARLLGGGPAEWAGEDGTTEWALEDGAEERAPEGAAEDDAAGARVVVVGTVGEPGDFRSPVGYVVRISTSDGTGDPGTAHRHAGRRTPR